MVLQIVMCGLLAISGFCCGKDIPASLSDNASPWIRAGEECSPLGSETPLNVSGDRVVLSPPVVNESFWIGAYAEYTTWIKILGCYTISTIVSAPVHNVTVLETHNVRACLEFCEGFIYFGLTASRCLCFNGSFSLSEIGRCIPQKCPGTDGDFCGGSSEAVVYQRVSRQYSGLGECLASGYVGDYNQTGGRFHWFGRAVVLPCDSGDLGYAYRTALSFPQGHQLHVYTLPVGSWQEAVLRSYQTALGILEFVSFLIASQSLSAPMEGDKYWVGLFRRHDFKFGLELPRFSDASCIAGRISDNGTLTLELRPCEQQLKVLCEGNNNDITSSPQASATVPVKRLTTAAKPPNSTIQSTNDITNIEKDAGLSETTKWYIILAGLSTLLLLVIIIIIACSITKINRQKVNKSLESTPNDYTDFRSTLEQSAKENATSSREELYLSIPEEEVPINHLVDRPRLSLPKRKFNGECRDAEPFDESKYNEIESEYSYINDGARRYEGNSSKGSQSGLNKAGDNTDDRQYFLLEKSWDSLEPEKLNEASAVQEECDKGNLYFEVEKPGTVCLYHELEKDFSVDSGQPGVVYHELEKPGMVMDVSGSNGGTCTKTNPRGKQKNQYGTECNEHYKAKSMKLKTEQNDERLHNKLKSCVSAPAAKSVLHKKSSKLRKKESGRKRTQNEIRISALPDVLTTNDSMYDILKKSPRISEAQPAGARFEDYDTMESVRTYLEKSCSDPSRDNIESV